MATYYPLVLTTSGSINVSDSNTVLNYMKFPVNKLYAPSSAFTTSLPDPYYIQTSSLDVSNASSTTSSSVFQFAPQGTPEWQYYLTNAILGVKSSTTAGVNVGLQTTNIQDRSVVAKVASTLTAFTYQCQGTDDPFFFVQPTTLAAANTVYPAYIQGVVNLLSGSLNNRLLVQSPSTTTATIASGSLFYNQFVGYSSSLTTVTSSAKPLYLSGSGVSTRMTTIGVGDTIIQSVLPLTRSLWNTTATPVTVTTTSATAYSDVFIPTGLTIGKRYLVNFYLIARSAATTTGVQVRWISGSTNCRGTIYTPVSATAYSIQNSADGTDITNLATAWPVANTNALIWGEFTFVKSGSLNPALQVKSEIGASSVSILSGSFILYREL